MLEVKRIQDGKVFVGEQEKELPMPNADWLQVHERDTISLAAGDKIVPTQTGQTMDGHRLQTKAVYEIEGFDDAGNIKLTNGWKVSKDFKHLAYGYYATSIGAQSATVDRVLLSFGADAYGGGLVHSGWWRSKQRRARNRKRNRIASKSRARNRK